MALGGFGALLAGLPQGLADAQERRRRDEETQLRQLGILQELKNWKDQQSAGDAGFSSLMGGAGDVQMPQPAGMPSGGGMPMPSVPDTSGAFPRAGGAPRPIAAPNMGGGMMAGGAIPARGTPERQQLKSLIYKDESGNRNIDQQVVPPGGGYNPSVGRVTGPSTASGPAQITDSTLRDVQRGDPTLAGYSHAKDMPLDLQDRAVDDLIDKRGVQPWAPYNAQLRKDLALPETQKAVGLTERQVAQSIPPMLQGNMNLKALAQAVDKANPNLPGYVKMQVVERLQKLMGTQSQEEWERYKFKSGQEEKQREFDIRQQELRQTRDETRQYRQDNLDFRREQGGDKGADWQIVQDGGKTYRVNRKTGEKAEVELSGDAHKMGGAGQPRSMPAIVMKKWLDENPNASADDAMNFAGKYKREQSIETAFAGGLTGRNLIALNTVADHIGLLSEYSEALRNNDIPKANLVLNKYAQETGHPEVNDFNAAKTIASDEIVRLLTSTGGTEQDRIGMQKLFSDANSPEQLAGAINVATRFVAGRLKALEQQYAGNDPGKRQRFEGEMLSPEARKVFGAAVPSATERQQRAPTGGGPQPGTVENGYRFKGGDPSDQNAWEPVK